MNDNPHGGVTDNLTDFFATNPDEAKTPALGGFSAYLLHLVVIAFAVYSGYHGINATAHYRAAAGLGAAAGVIGILVIEITMLGIYGAYFHRRITGDVQKYVAAATFGIGFLLSCLGIVGDSQTQAGLDVTSWLSAYLTWGLPIAPAIMALGAAAVLATEPRLLRLIRLSLKQEEYEEKRTRFQEKHADAKREIAQSTANVQLNTMLMTNAYILAAWKTPEVQAYIQANAIENVPDILRQVGVHVPYDAPLIIEGQIAPDATPADEATAQPDRPLADRIRARFRRSSTPDTAPAAVSNPTHDAPRQDEPQPPDTLAGQGATGRLHPDDVTAIAAAMLSMSAPSQAAHPNGQEVKSSHP